MIHTTKIEAHPHRGQKRVHDDPARFKVLACGRRWGKTRLGVHECLDYASQGKRAWWVSPSYKTGEVGWRPLKDIGARAGAEIRKVDRTIILPSGGSVTVRSADNPDSLRGEGLDFVVLDECAFISEAAWTEALRPALADRLGAAMFISTPKGHNWFWRAFQRGQDEHEDDWSAWCFPTSDNPFIADSEIEAAKKSLPDRVFRQEFLAEFIPDAGGVFRRVMEAATATPQTERIITGDHWHKYVIGVDLAKHNDFTVFSVMDITTQEQVYMDRDNKVDIVNQVDRLIALNKRFKPETNIIEINKYETFCELSRRAGLPVTEFTTTNATKQKAVDDLAYAFENGDIKILNDPVQVGELQAFEMTRTPSGMVRYAAPEGMHDDTVIALALAWQGARSIPAPMVVQPSQSSRWGDLGSNGDDSRWKRY